MAYTLIRGKFHIHYPDIPFNGPQPDGDTIKFEPDNPALVSTLRQRGGGPGFNNRGFINIRFEAIDALETHYQGHHQPLGLANGARDRMLELAGYTDVQFHPNAPTVSSATPLSPEGYVLSRTLDPHGRIVGFVFAGSPPEADGAAVCLHPERAVQSINARLLQEGQVHASFYDTLPRELRQALAEVAMGARTNNLGIWPQAVGTSAKPATITGAADVANVVIFPKLFRRLTSYFSGGATNLAGFMDWLRAVPGARDDGLVIPPMEFGNLHDIVEVSGNQIALTMNSEDFVIIDSPETFRSSLELAGCGSHEEQELAEGDLRIVAALPNPAGQDLGQETVTLLNTTPEPVDLAGYRLRDDDGQAGLALHGIVAGGETSRFTLDSSVRLGNQGDVIELVAPGGGVVDQVSYDAGQAGSGRTIAFGRT